MILIQGLTLGLFTAVVSLETVLENGAFIESYGQLTSFSVSQSQQFGQKKLAY